MGLELDENGQITSINKTFDLTGKTKLTVDVLSLTTCTSRLLCVRFTLTGGEQLICDTGNNQVLNFTGTGSFIVNIRAVDRDTIGTEPQPYCTGVIDNMRFE